MLTVEDEKVGSVFVRHGLVTFDMLISLNNNLLVKHFRTPGEAIDFAGRRMRWMTGEEAKTAASTDSRSSWHIVVNLPTIEALQTLGFAVIPAGIQGT